MFIEKFVIRSQITFSSSAILVEDTENSIRAGWPLEKVMLS